MPPMKNIEEAIELEHSRRRDSHLSNLATAHAQADDSIKHHETKIQRLKDLQARIIEIGNADHIDEKEVREIYAASDTGHSHMISGGGKMRVG